MASKVILILGAGPRVGYSVARKFKREGYNVAVASRNPDEQKAKEEGFLAVTVDLVDISSVKAAFAQVKEKLGIPNVVVYNGISSPTGYLLSTDLRKLLL